MSHHKLFSSFTRKLPAVILLVVILSASLTGCSKSEAINKIQENSSELEQRTVIEISVDQSEVNAPEDDLSVIPRIDGSTATIPLSEQLLADYRGVSVEEARLDVLHNKTHRAYERLILGEADIIFVTAPSDEELQMAKEAGIELEIYPIVSEGFVFLVNEQNPVTSLTQEQILGIYSGGITNWSEVGGENKLLIPYQRPWNSGSQSGMEAIVMKDTPLMNGPADYYMSEMNELVRAVAEYENTRQAIGYSYYYYVNSMYVKNEVRLLAIDGVVPDEETIKNGTYPYTTAYYAVIKANEPAGNNVRSYLDWILESGQDSAVKAGYIPLSEPDISEFLGEDKNTNYSYGNGIIFDRSFYKYELEQIPTIEVYGLKDKRVQNKINNKIEQTMDEIIKSDYPAYRGINQIRNHDGNDHIIYSVYDLYNQSNILSVFIEKNYSNYDVNDQVTLNFNLVTGEEITFADLFYEGYDYQNLIADYVNKNVADGVFPELGESMLYPLKTIGEKQKFIITNRGEIRLIFDYETPEFEVGFSYAEVPLQADLMPEGGAELQYTYRYETWDESLLEPGRHRDKLLKNQSYGNEWKTWVINPSEYMLEIAKPSVGTAKEDDRFAGEVIFETSIVSYIENKALAANVADQVAGIEERFLELYPTENQSGGQKSVLYRVEALDGYLLEQELYAGPGSDSIFVFKRYYRVSDMETGKQLLLADCFKAGVDYKKLLAEYIEEEISDDCQFLLRSDHFEILADDRSYPHHIDYKVLGNDNLTIFKEYLD